MPCTDSNARMAPTCKILAEPGFHCDLSAHGQPLCQVNAPAGAWYAAASWALALVALIAGPDLALNVIGRYPSWAISCCSRMLLNEPVVKLSFRLEPSVPPSPAVAPSTETTPASPPGILTLTLVFCDQPTLGVKTAASFWTAHCPAIDGDRAGIGEFGASGAENCTRMGLVPLTPFAPAAGVIETICRAAAGCSGLVAFAGPSDDTSEAWLPGDANATIITPDPMTSAAPLAVRAAPRLFGLVTPNDFQILLGAELS